MQYIFDGCQLPLPADSLVFEWLLLIRRTSGYIRAEAVWYTDLFYALNVPSWFMLRLQHTLISRGFLDVTCIITFSRKLPRRLTDLHRLLSAKFGKQFFVQGLLECNISSIQFFLSERRVPTFWQKLCGIQICSMRSMSQVCSC